MSSILKRSLVVAAIVGVGAVPSAAFGNERNDNTPPGQACVQDETSGKFFVDEGDPGLQTEATFATKGECASTVAQSNGNGNPDRPAR